MSTYRGSMRKMEPPYWISNHIIHPATASETYACRIGASIGHNGMKNRVNSIGRQNSSTHNKNEILHSVPIMIRGRLTTGLLSYPCGKFLTPPTSHLRRGSQKWLHVLYFAHFLENMNFQSPSYKIFKLFEAERKN